MSFRIARQTALLANGFRPALRTQLSRAIKELDISSRSATARRIHSARRRVKKVRSALRLLEAASFSSISRIDHDLLRDATAEVAAVRNAEANLAALKLLCSESGSDTLRFARAFAWLEKERSAASRGLTGAMHRASTLLKGSLSRIDAWNDRSIEWSDVALGMKILYKRARVAFRDAADDPSAENLHRWRKRTKDLFHGLKLLQAANPNALRRLARDAKKMGALLGANHDLAGLQDALGHSAIGKEKAVLDKLITSRRRKSQNKALRIGAAFFSRKASAIAGKIEG